MRIFNPTCIYENSIYGVGNKHFKELNFFMFGFDDIGNLIVHNNIMKFKSYRLR